MIPITKIGEKVAQTGARKKASAVAFHKAYKAAPGPTLGQYAKRHKFGIGLTVVGTGADVADMRHSSHKGIDVK